MTGVKIHLDFNINKLQQELKNFVIEASDLKTAHQSIGEYLHISHRERWDSERSPSGEKWTPLKEATKQAKTKNHNNILRHNDFLRDSLAYAVDGSGVEFGSNRVQAALMQFGGTPDMPAGPAAVPSREFLGISNDDSDEIKHILQDFLNGAIRS